MNYRTLIIAAIIFTFSKNTLGMNNKPLNPSQVGGQIYIDMPNGKGRSIPTVVGRQIDDVNLKRMMRNLGFSFKVKKIKAPKDVIAGTILSQFPAPFSAVTTEVIEVEIAE